jgi:O-antigen/teichoic acid export membrane protein
MASNTPMWRGKRAQTMVRARFTGRFLRLTRRPEARQAGILTFGSVAAQVAVLATAPWLSRLFAPDAFGVFSLLLMISTIGGSVGGLCYEMAIVLPRSQRAAVYLFRLAMVLSLVTPFATVGLVALVQYAIPQLFGRPLPADFYLYCFVATVLTAHLTILSHSHSRASQYGAVSVSKFTQTLAPAVFQIGLALAGMVNEGLLLGRVLGLWTSQLWLTRGLPWGFRLRDFRHMRITTMVAASRTYRDFLLQVPRQLLVRGATMLPAALLLGAYGPTVAGLYFFAQRLVERPGMLLGDALGRVPLRQFALRVQERKRLTRASLLYTAAVGTPVVAGVMVLALTAHPLFRIMFGARWEPAADYASVLAFWAAVRLVSLPLATLTTVLRVQKFSLFVDAIFAARVFIIPLLAARHASALVAVAGFCGLSIVYHLAIIATGLFAAMRYDRTLTVPCPATSAFTVARKGETYV